MYICPKCGEPLIATDKQMLCVNNHCFDISAKGYVNLLLGAKGGIHGDNKEMISARRAFLSLGHYSPIISTVADIIKNYTNNRCISILDAGCGEGYYTAGIKTALSKYGIKTEIYGLDVSKDAVSLAAKSYKDISFSVASVNALPFKSGSFDFVLSLFAPLCEAEFSRVLKPNGTLITVSPSENHLFGLKKAVYETPYKNPPSTFTPHILTKASENIDEWLIELIEQNDIQNLFKMTPYFYKTAPKDIQKALSLTQLKTEIGFVYGIYTK